MPTAPVSREVAVTLKRPVQVEDSALGAALNVIVDGHPGLLLMPTAPTAGEYGMAGQPAFEIWNEDGHRPGFRIPDRPDPIADGEWAVVANGQAQVRAVGFRFTQPGRLAVGAWCQRFVDWHGALIGVGNPELGVELTDERWADQEAPVVRIERKPTSRAFSLELSDLEGLVAVANSGQEIQVGRAQLLRAHSAYSQQEYRAAVAEGATALEIGLWTILSELAGTCPDGVQRYLLSVLKTATLGRLVRMAYEMMGPLHPSLTSNSRVVTLRNDVLHKDALRPRSNETWELLEAAYTVLDAAEPLPSPLKSPDWSHWKSNP